MAKKIKNKNTLRAEAKSRKYTFDEVIQIRRQAEDLAISKMAGACQFTHHLTLIVLEDDFGFGPKRRAKFIAAFNRLCKDYAEQKFTLDDVREIGGDLESACDKYIEEAMR